MKRNNIYKKMIMRLRKEMVRASHKASEGKLLLFYWDCIKAKYKKLWVKIDKAISIVFNKIIFGSLPIENNKIVMVTSRGTYNCHPRAICDEIIKRHLSYDIVWVVRNENIKNKDIYPPEIRLVKRDSYEFHKETATAKILIDNSCNLEYMGVKKRKRQILIETWHGTFGLKRFDAEVNPNRTWVRKAYKEAKQTDYILTNCEFEENLFKTSFWKKTSLLKFGHPRNDIIVSPESDLSVQIKQNVYQYFQIDPKTNIILFAPTYRDNKEDNYEQINYEAVMEAAEKRFGGEWCMLVRYHFLDRKLKKLEVDNNPKIINATGYPDIQDLMLVTDIGITDYSSWIYDYMFTKKPCFIFTPDLNDYVEREREFVFELGETPFPLAENNMQLIDNILSFDEGRYTENYNTFCKKFNCYENGNASKKMVDLIESIMS